MTTEIKTWEIVGGKLVPVATTLAEQGRTEALDLESWIESDASIIRPGLKVIGRQVQTRSGPLDLLAIDRSGALIIIELKRDKLPREALAQAVDYAADVATWSLDKISEVCAKFTGESLEDVLSESFTDLDLESININDSQRIVLVGFSIEPALERMIEWLSESYGVAINALVLKYVCSANGAEILTRTAVISEEIEETRIQKRKFKVEMSDEPGIYEDDELRANLLSYLSQSLVTVQRIRDVLLPACLERDQITREELKTEFAKPGILADPSKAGNVLSLVSSQMGMKKNDFIRQVVGYEYPNNYWEKDNYFLRPEYRELVKDVLLKLSSSSS